MSLRRYQEMRDFSRTPEPRGAVGRSRGAGTFVIQKHAATRLHYDFRLEMDGVLRSWAVPKGPSLDPGDKRLAVHVEDHPLDYGGFEGIIPRGEYGGGSVVLWDRGTWHPEGDAAADYARGRLKFRLAGEKLRGGFTLVRMHGPRSDDGKNWLLIKEHDAEARDDGELLVRERPESILSGRTVEEIAAAPTRVWRSNRGGSAGGARTLDPAEQAAAARGRRTTPAPTEAGDAEARARKRLGLTAKSGRKAMKAGTTTGAPKTSARKQTAAKTGVAKKTAAKTAAKTRVAKKTAARKAAKTGVAKKKATRTGTTTAAKKAAKTGVAKKKATKTGTTTAAKKAAKTGVAKKTAAKTGTTKKTAAKTGTTKKTAAKTAARTGVAKKAAARTGVAKKAAARTGVAKKTAGKKAAKTGATKTRAATSAAARGASGGTSAEASAATTATVRVEGRARATRAPRRAPASYGHSPVPEVVQPELATLVSEVPAGDEWLHEIKYDGCRIVARVDRGQIQLLTRKGEDWSGRLPWLADALRARVPLEAALIDGELVHMGADGVTRFGPLQQALSTGQHGPLVYFAFDLLHVQGIDLRRQPLEQRKQALAELLPPEPTPGRVRLSEHVLGQGEPLFTRACRLGLEGVISKRRAAPYLAGRHRDWLKVKCGRRQEVVIGGFTAARSGTRKIGALLLGVHDADGRFVYAGKVGTGLGQQEAADLRARLDELEVPRSPFSGPLPPGFSRSRFVRPEVVIEVGFTEWTSDGRMRHPVFHGVREDKRPREVRREVEVPVELAARAPARPVRHVGRARSRKPEAEVLGVRLSNPDRVLYPADGIHKLDLAEHHAALAAWMLPWVAGRPISVVRCPDGVGAPCFFQKHIHHELPPALRTADLDGGAHEPFLYLEDAAGLVALAQVGVIEIHVWGATVARPDAPDRMILDLDPDPDVPWARVKETAAAMRARLAELGLASFLKTTGGKGLHVVAPLTPGKQDWDQVKAFTRGLALEFARAAPELFTATATKSRRKGKIYIDYLRNYRGSTSVAPYSPRARDGAPVSTPLRWDELAALESSQKYTLANLAARLGKLREDPWAALPGTRQHLSAALLREVARG